MTLLLLNYQLIEIPAGAELHDDVELLPLDDGLAVRYDVDMLECLQQFDLIEDILSLFCSLVGKLYLLDYVIFVLNEVASQVCVAEGAESKRKVPLADDLQDLVLIHYYKDYKWV